MSKVGIKELASLLAHKRNIEIGAATRFVTALFEILSEGIYDDKVVKIRGLGTFKLIAVSARKSVDVNTGESIELSGRDKITFTPDACLRDLVNRPFAQFETVVVNDGVDFSEIDARMEHPELLLDTVDENLSEAEMEEAVAADVVQDAASAVEDTKRTVPENEKVKEALSVEENVTPQQEVMESDVKAVAEDKEENITRNEVLPVSVPPVADACSVTEIQPPVADGDTTVTIPPADHAAEDKQYELLRVQNEYLAEANELLRDQLEHSRRTLRLFGWILGCLVLFCMAGAYFLGTHFPMLGGQAASEMTVEKSTSPTGNTAGMAPDSLETIARDTIAVPKSREVVTKNQETSAVSAPVVNNVAAKAAETEKPRPMAQYDTDPRVRTGAYYIIGVKTTVTVRAGQTLASISKAYLGPGMECYVEALNGVKSVTAGQVIKIPELRIKRK